MIRFDRVPDRKEISRRIENCRLTGRKVLDLSNLDMTELHAEIEGFVNLAELNASYNQLDSPPDWIGDFTALKYLNLRHCGLASLPDPMKNLVNLRTLYLGANCLSALPEWLGGFTMLEELDISANELYSIPEFIGNLKNLRALDLGHMKLKSLPDFLSALRLESLKLGNNGVSQSSGVAWLNDKP